MAGRRGTAKKAAAAGSKSKAKKKGTKKDQEESSAAATTIIPQLLEFLQALAQDSARCTALWLSWEEASSSSSTPSIDAWSILLTTEVINQLLRLRASSESSSSSNLREDDDKALAYLSYFLSSILTEDKYAVEHAATLGGGVARAWISATIASFTVLCRGNHQQVTTPAGAAGMALHRLMHLSFLSSSSTSSSSSPTSTGGLSSSSSSDRRQLEGVTVSFPGTTSKEWSEFCGSGTFETDTSSSMKDILACWTALQPVIAEAASKVTTPASSKSSGRSKKARKTASTATSTAAAVASPFSSAVNDPQLKSLFGKLPQMHIESRTAVKRWSSMVIIWMLQPAELLERIPELCEHNYALALHLACLVTEANQHCGARPPTGGFDTYGKSVAASCFPEESLASAATTASSGGSSSGRKSAKRAKPDVRASAVRAIQALIVSNSATEPSLLTSAKLTSLCKASSMSLSTYSEQSQAAKRMTTLAIATILQQPQASVPLLTFATTHLGGYLRDSSSNAGGSISASDWLLSEPLPDADSDDNESYGGVFPSHGTFSRDHVLATILRSLPPTQNDPAETRIVTKLLDILQQTYQSWLTPDTTSSKSGTSKRSRSASSRSKKRRKTNEADVKETANSQTPSIETSTALMAAEVWNCISGLLEIKSTDSPSSLRRLVRKSLTAEQIGRFAELGVSLDHILLEPKRHSKNDLQHDDFLHYEKNLWSAQLQSCCVLGRGAVRDGSLTVDLSSPRTSQGNTRYLPSRREVYRLMISGDTDRNSKTNFRAPLVLPVPCFVLLASNMMAEPRPSSRTDALPERDICKVYIEAIGSSLRHWPTAHSEKKRMSSDHSLHLDDQVPLSLQSARLFLLAASRLPDQDLKACFDKLSSTVFASLTAVSNSSIFHENEEYATFCGRVFALGTALLQWIIYGPVVLRHHLHQRLGALQSISLPTFYSISGWYRSDNCFMGVYSDWESPSIPGAHSRSPGSTSTSMESLKLKSRQDWIKSLELGFSLGLQTAKQDICHLMFASWNGLDQIKIMEYKATAPRQSYPTLGTNADDLPRRILEIRQDMCHLQRELAHSVWSTRLSPVFRAMLNKVEALLDNVIKKYATSDEMVQEIPAAAAVLLSSLPTYIAAVVAAHTKAGTDYFSTNLRADRTKRSRAYSSESEEHRIHASDLISVESEGEYENEARIDALARLRDCCEAFGAAPIHPDWLDVSCRLREGVSFTNASDTAQCALRCLTKLITVAMAESKKWQFRAVQDFHEDEELLGVRTSIALDLGKFAGHDPSVDAICYPCPYSEERDWKEDVTTFCRLHPDVMDLIMEESAVKNVDQVKESWCPNAAQQLVGRLQESGRLVGGWEASQAELRAGGEWELLLTESLATASLDIGAYSVDLDGEEEDSGDDDDSSAKKGHEAMIAALRWRNVLLSATSNILPAAALLRMSIRKVGREPHPFSFNENSQDPFEAAPLKLSEMVPSSLTVEESTTSVIYKTIDLLARLSVDGDELLTASAHAAASHLVTDSSSFSDIEAIHGMRFVFHGLVRFRNLVDQESLDKEQKEILPLLVHQLVSVFEDFAKSSLSNSDDSSTQQTKQFYRALSFFGGSGVPKPITLLGSPVEPFEILASSHLEFAIDGFENEFRWGDRAAQAKTVEELVSILFHDALQAQCRTRECIAAILGSITTLEVHSAVERSFLLLPSVVSAFNMISEERIDRLVSEDLCSIGERNPRFRKDISTTLAMLLCIKDGTSFDGARRVFDLLLESSETWMFHDGIDIEPVRQLLFLYACRFQGLQDVGSRMLGHLNSLPKGMTVSSQHLQAVATFFAFIKSLNGKVMGSTEIEAVDIEQTQVASERDLQLLAGEKDTKKYPQTCSYVLQSGFYGQHWYNCYTCNLVWDKGCCTLCALSCHRGHDIAYSRYSSFFCDCGADDTGARASRSRPPCRCLSAGPATEARELFEKDSVKGLLLACSPCPSDGEPNTKPLRTKHSNEVISVQIVARYFLECGKDSMAALLASARKSDWLDSLFGLLKHTFEDRKKTASTGHNDMSALLELAPAPVIRQHLSAETLKRNLRTRAARPLLLRSLGSMPMLPVRVGKGFQMKLSTDSSTNSRLVSRLERQNIDRRVVAADKRGRMVLAEACSLTFFCPVPATNVRHTAQPCEMPLSRHQFCILGKAATTFNVVGLSVCQSNERHLLVWGTSSASVVIVKPGWDGIEEKLDLCFDLDSADGEFDYLVKCQWSPQSETHVIVGCGRFVRIFDISRKETGKKVVALISYNLGFEASLRDLAIAPCLDQNDADNSSDRLNSKLFLLLGNGRVHVVDLRKTSSFGIQQSEQFEASECMSFSLAGVRSKASSALGLAGSTTRSLGEGSRLVYLEQCRMLLYKGVASCVIAVMLDENGEVEGTFELLPHLIDAEILGDSEGCSGPYTHWTELGVVYRDGSTYFRVACVGKSLNSRLPVLLSIDFNDSDVFVKLLPWATTSSVGLTLSLGGMTSFSAPFLIARARDARPVFGERSFLVAASANGSIMLYGEDDMSCSPSQQALTAEPVPESSLFSDANEKTKKPTFPLTIFERLENLSQSDEVVFACDEVGSDQKDMKNRFSRDTSVFFMVPRREGCTITISLKTDLKQPLPLPQHRSAQKLQHRAITALRVLVGSTSSECIPSQVFVHGRPVDITPGVKKWYSLPLTEEEIALSIRNGFVSLGIGGTLDSSNNPLIDAVEVYATSRKIIDTWLPKSFFPAKGMSDSVVLSRPQDTDSQDEKTNNDADMLELSAKALLSLCQVLGGGKVLSREERNFLRDLVKETALGGSSKVGTLVQDLIRILEADNQASFYDKSVLLGCSATLSRANDIAAEVSQHEDSAVGSLGLVFQDCLKTSALIALERPMNYLESMEGIMEDDASKTSIALSSAQIITSKFERSPIHDLLICGPHGVVELALIEMAINMNSETAHPRSLATFEAISKFLASEDLHLVSKCCDAISSFCLKHSNAEQTGSKPHLITMFKHVRKVAYACDSCVLFPLTGIRYSHMGEIDLCKECYEIGMEFASSKGFHSNTHVVIKGKKIGRDTKLTCAKMKQMKAISLPKANAQLGVSKMDMKDTTTDKVASSSYGEDEDEDLQKALRMSLGENIADEDQLLSNPNTQLAYEEFITHLFSEILALFTRIVKRKNPSRSVGPIAKLLLDFLRQTKSESSQVERGKNLSKVLTDTISYILAAYTSEGLSQSLSHALVVCNRACTDLISLNTLSENPLVAENAEETPKSVLRSDKTSPEHVCKVHNIPAVRRRCASGPDKDRRFYVCGKPRGSRCNYFVWVDEVKGKADKTPNEKSRLQKILQPIVWNHFSEGELPLHARLCEVMEKETFNTMYDASQANDEPSLSDPEKPRATKKMKSHYGGSRRDQDLADGVPCSLEKLLVQTHRASTKHSGNTLKDLAFIDPSVDQREWLLQSSVDVITSMADYQAKGISRWFSFLCEISMSKVNNQSIRPMAKRALKTLCGGNTTMYHSVRDHFSFGFKLKEIFQMSGPLLTASMKVKEKARLCGEDWAGGEESSWKTLSVGGLLGVQDLIPEDSFSHTREARVEVILDEILAVVKSRGKSWRRFCGLEQFPLTYRESGVGTLELSETPPIVALFYLACCSKGSNQIKLIGLIDLALDDPPALRETVPPSSEDDDRNHQESEAISLLEGSRLDHPKDVLINGRRPLTIDEFVAFAIQFVLNGRSSQLRKIAYHVAVKLTTHYSISDTMDAFLRLFQVSIETVGDLGRSSTESMNLLQLLAGQAHSSTSVKRCAADVLQFFMEQVNAAKCDRSNGEWTILEYGSGSSQQKHKIDTSDCVCCWRTQSLGSSTKLCDSSSVDGLSRTSKSSRPTTASTSRVATTKKWHAEQVSPFVRGRLDGGKERSVSNEFCSFFMLKYRLAVSDIHLTVNDPRGRFVKTITIFHSSRPISDVNTLKTEGFVWQKCATIKLSRGATKATASLKQPIVAANIKIEYTEFYERPGGSKSADGSFIVYCPRCTRTVTNAHGVCGHCGEVAFQCRKCRHINYDRLDAFLCVECGFCAAGSFSFELTAGVASNAVAITNDEEFLRLSKMLSAAETIKEEIRSKLRETIRQVHSTRSDDRKDTPDDSIFNPALKRALLGLPPAPPPMRTVPSQKRGSSKSTPVPFLDRVDKPGSVVKFVVRPESNHGASRYMASASTDRSRSLIRLARQLRADSGSSERRRAASDIVARHLGRGAVLDVLEEDSDLLDLHIMEGLSGGSAEDPFVRSVNIASGGSARTSGTIARVSLSRQAKREALGTDTKKIKSSKQLIEECKRLYTLMREAEREAYEIRRRIEAWQRLESNQLYQSGGEPSLALTENIPFSPSHCSSCNTSVALQLLMLWSKLFEACPAEVQVPREFLHLLLQDLPGSSKHFIEYKRQVVTDIATKSKSGAKFVLEELRKRLMVMHDPACAEILGKIMQVEDDGFEFAEDYRNLALEILASNDASIF